MFRNEYDPGVQLEKRRRGLLTLYNKLGARAVEGTVQALRPQTGGWTHPWAAHTIELDQSIVTKTSRLIRPAKDIVIPATESLKAAPRGSVSMFVYKTASQHIKALNIIKRGEESEELSPITEHRQGLIEHVAAELVEKKIDFPLTLPRPSAHDDTYERVPVVA